MSIKAVGLLLIACVLALAAGCVPPSPTVPRPPAAPVRLVVADSRDETHPWLGTLVRPVDADTLTDLPGFQPLDFAACGGPLPSPDGKVLAIATAAHPKMPGEPALACNLGGQAELRLFDLETWAWMERHFSLPMHSVSPYTWSRDGKRLYVFASAYARGQVRDLSAQDITTWLWILDATGASPPVSTQLGYAYRGIHLAPDGSVLYILGYNSDPTEQALVATDPTFLAVVDADTGAERTRIALPDLKVGQRRQTDAQGRPEYWTFEPGLALAPDGSRYYVARADEPLVDVVDLRANRIERTVRADVPTAGATGWFLNMFASPAMAKGGPGVAALLALSKDGRTLYTRLYAKDRPLDGGIFLIDTRTWQVRPFASTASNVEPSRNGRWLYVRDVPYVQRPGAPAELLADPGRRWDGGGLRVLDATTGHEAATLLKDKLQLGVLVQRGADRVYATVPAPDYHATQPYREGEVLVELIAFEVGSWRELARRPGHLNLRIATAPW